MIPVETTPGIMGEGEMKENGRGGICMIYLIHCKQLCKCHNVPPPITTIKRNEVTKNPIQNGKNKTK
jgi:hypothetical protein